MIKVSSEICHQTRADSVLSNHQLRYKHTSTLKALPAAISFSLIPDLSYWAMYRSLHVLPVYAWVLFGYSDFLPLSTNMHVRLIGVSKIVLRSECGCLSLCGPVMDRRTVQGVPRLSPNDSWDRLQPPCDPTDGLSGYRK